MRDSLEEERRAAILKRVECELELGRHADLVGELRHLLAQYPLDEAFIAHQMTALYGSGRPGEALSLYRDIRSRLIEEEGTEPGPVLAELHQRILRHDPQLAVRSTGPGQGRIPRPDTLPPGTSEFVGRSEELELLTREDGEAPRVSVIEGMAGVGKTALALQAARAVAGQYPDGTFYLNLHTHDPGHPSLDATEAQHRLLRMLTAPATQIPDAPGGARRTAAGPAEPPSRHRDPRRRRRRRPDPPAAARGGPVPDPHHHPAQTARPGRRPRADPGRAVHRRCDHAVPAGRGARQGPGGRGGRMAVELCGRLPLAIQLAAGGLAQDYPPRLGDLVEELSHSAARSADPGSASPEVMSAFDLAYRSLEPAHQRFFRRLGMSPCAHISPQAAAALGGRHPGRGGGGPRRPARPPPAGAGSGRAVPVPRPHPRLRGPARGARGLPVGAAAGRRQAARLLPAHRGRG